MCRWPGSAHDSHIFRNSNICLRLENDEMNPYVLLGDSGYPLKKYLITPLLNLETAAERKFNQAQIKTRGIIERTFGIWKRRFPILSLGIRNKLETAQSIIVGTAVIHNIAQERHDFIDNLPDMPNDDDVNNINNNENEIANYRYPFIEYFQHLL